MRAGKLDHLVEIQRRVETGRDAMNNPIIDWETVAEDWAQPRPNRGEERFAAAEVAGGALMTFHMRWRDDVSVEDRLIFRGRTWDIIDVRMLGREVVLEIDAKARAEPGHAIEADDDENGEGGDDEGED